MIKLRVRPIKVRRWFPPGDPVATAVATLCVLREDFFLELQGIIRDDLASLDGNSTAYRRTYFWRNSFRTLEEIRKTFNALTAIPAFRLGMLSETRDVQGAFEEARRTLNRASETFLRELRNELGGHIDLSRMQAGLDSMDVQQEGIAQLGRIRENTHYKFAVELLWSAILRDSPGAATSAHIEKVLGETAALTSALGAVDDVISRYALARAL